MSVWTVPLLSLFQVVSLFKAEFYPITCFCFMVCSFSADKRLHVYTCIVPEYSRAEETLGCVQLSVSYCETLRTWAQPLSRVSVSRYYISICFRVSVFSVDKLQRQAVHHAAARGTVNTVRLLLMRGVGINTPDYGGSTPLHHAAAAGNQHMVEFLLSQVSPKPCMGATNTWWSSCFPRSVLNPAWGPPTHGGVLAFPGQS